QHAYDLQDALAQYVFSRGMKVTSRDIKQLVAEALREKAKTIPPAAKKPESLIDTLIREEMLQFTSLDQIDDPVHIGSRPPSPEEISGVRPKPSPGELVDPRSWVLDGDGDGDGEEDRPRSAPVRRGNARRPPPTSSGLQAETSSTGRIRVAEPLAPPGRPASAPGAAGVESLEKLLEGPTKTGPRPSKPFPTLIVIAVVALAALGAGAVFVLRSGVLHH